MPNHLPSWAQFRNRSHLQLLWLLPTSQAEPLSASGSCQHDSSSATTSFVRSLRRSTSSSRIYWRPLHQRLLYKRILHRIMTTTNFSADILRAPSTPTSRPVNTAPFFPADFSTRLPPWRPQWSSSDHDESTWTSNLHPFNSKPMPAMQPKDFSYSFPARRL